MSEEERNIAVENGLSLSEEQQLYWEKAMFPEVEEKGKEIERLKNQLEEKTYLYNKLSTESKYVIAELHSIIKEVREYIEKNKQKIIPAYGDNFDDDFDIALDEEDIDNMLGILDKVDKE